MYIKDYFPQKIKQLELFCFLTILIFFPLSESIKQIFFWLLVLLFIANKILEKNIYFDNFTKGLLIFLLGNTIPIVFSTEPKFAFKWAYNIFMYSALYLILINEFRSENQIKLIRTFFLVGLFLGLLWGIFVWKIAWEKPRLEIHSVGAPNATGTYLGICLMFIIGMLSLKIRELYDKNLKVLIFYLIVLILLIISIILNGSRGMYVGLISALTYLGIIYYVKYKKITFFLFLVLILFSLSIGATFYTELTGRFFNPASLLDRFRVWERSLMCFLINPFTGGGGKICYADPDNLFIAILSRAGIVGILSFTVLIYYFLKEFNKSKFSLALLIFLLFNGIFETSLKHEPALTFIITLFLITHENTNS